MRTLSSLDHSTSSKLTTPSPTTTTTKTTFSSPAIIQKSPWHSPVPYLFGGLAAMLGLIAFALLLLACSYWRLSSHLNNRDSAVDRDAEEQSGAEKTENPAADRAMPVFEEKIVVIMAGEIKPTFLATPISKRASSFGDEVKRNEGFGKESEEIVVKQKEEETDDQNVSSTEAAEESHEQNQP